MKTIIFDLCGTLLKCDCLEPFRDSLPCLSSLYKDYNLYLVTEGQKINDLHALLEKSRLLKYFSYVLHTKNSLLKKGDGSAFLHIIKIFNLTPEDIIIIGDMSSTDIKGAKCISAKSIKVTRKDCTQSNNPCIDVRPDFEVNSLSEIKMILHQVF